MKLFSIRPVSVTLHQQVAMETLPAGWMVQACEPERAGTGLLKGASSGAAADAHVHDLFHEDAKVRCSHETGPAEERPPQTSCSLWCFHVQGSQQASRPWWRIQLFVWEPVLFGTWDGVFTTCMINIFGVVLFLRTGFLVVSQHCCSKS